MALSAAAQLLDELMGRNRNINSSESQNEIRWEDDGVCKYYICGFCPHDLFVNTRADLGTCDKLHDDALRKEYQQSSGFEKMGYEEEFFRYLQQLVQDVEKRIRRGHQRLALSNNNLSFNPAQVKEDKLSMLTEKINELVEQAEELGCEGKVEEAQGVMKLCEQLREERKQIESTMTTELEYPTIKEMEVCEVCGAFLIVSDLPQRVDEHLMGRQHVGYSTIRVMCAKIIEKSMQANQSTEPEKMMEVCTVCGALLVVGDVQQRVDEHIMGKQHAGYARIRSYVEGVKEKKEKDLEKEARLLKEREEREIERQKERETRKQREREKELEKEKMREKEREKDKERRRDRHRKRSRSRDRRRSSSRERKRSRSRSRNRHHRSRSRDRHSSRRHRSRSRSHSKKSERRRSRSREKKSSRRRSRSREKRRRSRSRDSQRSRSKDSRRRSRSRDRSKEKKYDQKESFESFNDPDCSSRDGVTSGMYSDTNVNGEDSMDARDSVENPIETTNTDCESHD